MRQSLKRLRATVLGETHDQLEDIQVPEGERIFPESAVIASYRTSAGRVSASTLALTFD
jgi:hypothetical protein